MNTRLCCGGVLAAVLLIGGCGGGAGDDAADATANAPRVVDDERLRNAASEPDNWLTHGGTYLEQRFSPLTQIDKDSLARLAPAWYYEFDTYAARKRRRSSPTACSTRRARGARRTR
jgi:quinohemoprotein ethanol dehydrogenase